MKKLIALLALVIASCGSPKPTLTESVYTRDSISTTVTIKPKDTLIRVAGDQVTMRVPILELTQVPVSLTSQSGRTTATVSKQGNDLFVDCKTDSLELKIQLLEKTINTLRQKDSVKETVIEVPVLYIPWHIKALAWGGRLLLLLGVAGAAYLIFKLKF